MFKSVVLKKFDMLKFNTHKNFSLVAEVVGLKGHLQIISC